METLEVLPTLFNGVGNTTARLASSFDYLLSLTGIVEADYKRTSDALFLVSVSAYILLLLLRRALTISFEEKPKFPPSPPRWPILGNLPQIMNHGAQLHTTFRIFAQKLGPIYTVWLGMSFPLVIVTGEDTVQEAVIAQSSVFSSRPRLLSWQYISSNYRTTMTSPMGPHWQKLRKIISHDLLSPTKLDSYKPVRDSEIRKLLDRLRDQAEENGGIVDPLDRLRESAVDIIMRIGFGDDFAKMEGKGQKAKVVELDRCFRDLMDAGSIFQIAIDSSLLARILFFPAARKAYKNIRTVATKTATLILPIVQQRKKQLKERPVTAAPTFVDALITLEGENSLTDMEIVWNVVELMVGGTDNTSHILEWVLANMIKYPHIQQKAYEEVKRAMGPNLERVLVQEIHLQNLPYLQAIVKESMRRHMMTVLAIPKIAAQDCKLRGYDIPKGTMVVFHAGALSLNETIWTDPLEFRPERFLNDEKIATEKHRFAFMPFGAGRRSCPGANMGLLHLHLLLANLLYAYEWGPESPGKPVDFTEKFRMTVTMKNPLRATVTKRVHF